LPFAQQDIFDSPPFWLGVFYVSFPLGLLLYGWNDLGDVASDQLNPRKDSWLFGARPNYQTRHRLPWIIGLVQLPFVVLFTILAGMKMLLWFSAVLLTNATYNSLGFKKLPGLDLLNQVGYLLIFVLASWLCTVPQMNAPVMMFSALFAMQSHLFGQLMDIDEDRAAGRRSTAIVLGRYASKLLLVLLMLIESGIAYAYFRGTLVATFMLIGAALFLADTALGPARYPVWYTKLFFISWNLIVISTMHFVWRYGLFVVE
jgi:4-hydroxybenzoate polyprenyltransferase